MNVLIWKKTKELKKSKLKNLIFLILPIIYFVALLKLEQDIQNIIAFYPLTFTLFSVLIDFSIEDLISTETILATNLSIEKIWKSNLIWNVSKGYIYSTFIMCFGLLYLSLNGINININLGIIVQYFICILTAFSLIGMATCHYADYSYSKQIIASIFSLINLTSPLILLFLIKKPIVNLNLIILSLILSCVLLLISLYIINKSNKEKLIINMSKLVYTYNNSLEE